MSDLNKETTLLFFLHRDHPLLTTELHGDSITYPLLQPSSQYLSPILTPSPQYLSLSPPRSRNMCPHYSDPSPFPSQTKLSTMRLKFINHYLQITIVAGSHSIMVNSCPHPCGDTVRVIPIPTVTPQTSSPLLWCSCRPHCSTALYYWHQLCLELLSPASSSTRSHISFFGTLPGILEHPLLQQPCDIHCSACLKMLLSFLVQARCIVFFFTALQQAPALLSIALRPPKCLMLEIN